MSNTEALNSLYESVKAERDFKKRGMGGALCPDEICFRLSRFIL